MAESVGRNRRRAEAFLGGRAARRGGEGEDGSLGVEGGISRSCTRMSANDGLGVLLRHSRRHHTRVRPRRLVRRPRVLGQRETTVAAAAAAIVIILTPSLSLLSCQSPATLDQVARWNLRGAIANVVARTVERAGALRLFGWSRAYFFQYARTARRAARHVATVVVGGVSRSIMGHSADISANKRYG